MRNNNLIRSFVATLIVLLVFSPLVILDVKAQPVPPIDPEPFTITTAIVLVSIVILGIVIGILVYYKTNKTKARTKNE